jgi:hypothetical protein
MRNRAKCKLCNEILESFHQHDYVTCKCGEISIDGGLQYLHAIAKNWSNFLRIDDEGNEIIVTVKSKEEAHESIVKDNANSNKSNPSKENESVNHKPKKSEMISMLQEIIKSYENLPQHAMLLPISHYDFVSVLLLVSAILELDN